jgi:hypothetical protein
LKCPFITDTEFIGVLGAKIQVIAGRLLGQETISAGKDYLKTTCFAVSCNERVVVDQANSD